MTWVETLKTGFLALQPIYMYCFADYDDEANDLNLVCSRSLFCPSSYHPSHMPCKQDVSLKLGSLILDYEWITRLSFEGSPNITS